MSGPHLCCDVLQQAPALIVAQDGLAQGVGANVARKNGLVCSHFRCDVLQQLPACIDLLHHANCCCDGASSPCLQLQRALLTDAMRDVRIV